MNKTVWLVESVFQGFGGEEAEVVGIYASAEGAKTIAFKLAAAHMEAHPRDFVVIELYPADEGADWSTFIAGQCGVIHVEESERLLDWDLLLTATELTLHE